ncbi:hypothetical protein ACTQ56_10360 [[Clostridium] aminophilum]|uniref:hypothetical protein n=1 Tax=[Clostridium] aminophilum TaxID=1526 RepID=UPI002A70FB8A|nr:hypothetical protein [Clostridium sp.]
MRRIMAIYDPDEDYAYRFAEIINRRERMPFEVIAFPSLESLERYAKENNVAVLMAGGKADHSRVRAIRAEKRVWLEDGRSLAKDADSMSIYKYQSSDSIIREVMSEYCDSEEITSEDGIRGKAEILGVYSPAETGLRDAFAVTLGRIFSQRTPSLYISLEEFSGMGILTGDEFREDLSDLLYYYGAGSYSNVRLGSIVHSLNGLDFVPPVRCPSDLDLSSEGIIPGLIGTIASESTYRKIILDLGRCRKVTPKILAMCAKVYMPLAKNGLSGAKMGEFEEYLKNTGDSSILDRVQKVYPPTELPSVSRGYFDQLLWGPMGRYIRGLVMGGTYEEEENRGSGYAGECAG